MNKIKKYFPAIFFSSWIKRLFYWVPIQVRDALKFYHQTVCIYEQRSTQTPETVRALEQKYTEKAALGNFYVMDLFKLLGECHDPTSVALGAASQLTHCLQVAEGMEKDGISDPDLLIAALTHDLGKLLLSSGEAVENVVGMRSPLGKFPQGIGWDNCIFNWGHDDFIYMRLKAYLPDHVSWLLRHHSLLIKESGIYMDERDKDYYHRYMKIFQEYDNNTKSLICAPQKTLADYRTLIESYFPEKILF